VTHLLVTVVVVVVSIAVMPVYQMHSILRNSLNSQSAVIFQCHESLEMIKITMQLHAHHNAS